MFDLSGLSLNALLETSSEADLVERYRTTDWVVVLTIKGREVVLNHENARIFLLGLIYGATIKGGMSEPVLDDSGEWEAYALNPKRIMLG